MYEVILILFNGFFDNRSDQLFLEIFSPFKFKQNKSKYFKFFFKLIIKIKVTKKYFSFKLFIIKI